MKNFALIFVTNFVLMLTNRGLWILDQGVHIQPGVWEKECLIPHSWLLFWPFLHIESLCNHPNDHGMWDTGTVMYCTGNLQWLGVGDAVQNSKWWLNVSLVKALLTETNTVTLSRYCPQIYGTYSFISLVSMVYVQYLHVAIEHLNTLFIQYKVLKILVLQISIHYRCKFKSKSAFRMQ